MFLTEIHQHINAALAQLSPEHRTVIILKEIEDLKYQEIAEVLNVSVGTVMSRLFYGRETHRKVEDYGTDSNGSSAKRRRIIAGEPNQVREGDPCLDARHPCGRASRCLVVRSSWKETLIPFPDLGLSKLPSRNCVGWNQSRHLSVTAPRLTVKTQSSSLVRLPLGILDVPFILPARF
jgi:hypothetical protein